MYLQKQRTDDSYDKFYDSVVVESSDLTDEPTLPRIRKLPRRLNDGAPDHQHQSPKDYYRQKYFEAIDVVTTEIARRFNQSDLDVVADMERLLIDSANDSYSSIPDSVRTLYSGDVNMERLPVHLRMLPDLIKRHGERVGLSIKKVSSIRTICDIMSSTPLAKELLSEVHRLLLLYVTVPVTTSTSERTFSALRRVKTYLRSSMTQERLNHLLLLYCHKARTEALDLTQIAATFVAINERRGHYFGTMIRK